MDSHIVPFLDEYKRHLKFDAKAKGQYLNFVFLCGAKKHEDDNRSKLQNFLIKRHDIRCLYAEDLLNIIIVSDNLSFEEILAEMSTSIIIIAESMGSACELGAFSYVDSSLHKLFVINNKDFLGKDSFINNGPIRKIQNFDPAKVSFEEFKDRGKDIEPELIVNKSLENKILSAIPEDKTFSEKAIEVSGKTLKIKNLGYFQLIILDLIRILGFVQKDDLISILMYLYDCDNLTFEFASKNQIDFTKNFKRFKATLYFLCDTLERFKLIVSTSKKELLLNYSSITSTSYSLLSQTGALLTTDYLGSKQFAITQAKAYNYAKKRGFTLWA